MGRSRFVQVPIAEDHQGRGKCRGSNNLSTVESIPSEPYPRSYPYDDAHQRRCPALDHRAGTPRDEDAPEKIRDEGEALNELIFINSLLDFQGYFEVSFWVSRKDCGTPVQAATTGSGRAIQPKLYLSSSVSRYLVICPRIPGSPNRRTPIHHGATCGLRIAKTFGRTSDIPASTTSLSTSRIEVSNGLARLHSTCGCHKML